MSAFASYLNGARLARETARYCRSIARQHPHDAEWQADCEWDAKRAWNMAYWYLASARMYRKKEQRHDAHDLAA